MRSQRIITVLIQRVIPFFVQLFKPWEELCKFSETSFIISTSEEGKVFSFVTNNYNNKNNIRKPRDGSENRLKSKTLLDWPPGIIDFSIVLLMSWKCQEGRGEGFEREFTFGWFPWFRDALPLLLSIINLRITLHNLTLVSHLKRQPKWIFDLIWSIDNHQNCYQETSQLHYILNYFYYDFRRKYTHLNLYSF